MDHNEAIRKSENLMLKRADQAQEAATGLEPFICPSQREISTARTSTGKGQS